MAFTLLFTLVLLGGFIMVANWLELRADATLNARWVMALTFLNLPLIATGLLFAVGPETVLAALVADSNGDVALFRGDGITLTLTGLFGLLATLGPVRRLAATHSQLQPDRPVHVVALLLAGFLIGTSAGTLLQGGLLDISERAQAATLADVGLNYLLFFVLALTGTGLFTRRDLGAIGVRLGLTRPTLRQALFAAGIILPLVFLQGAIGAAWAVVDPGQAELLAGVNEILYAEFDTPLEWLLVAFATGMAEETLFRGALQPVFGLWGTAVLFAVAHTQYALTPATLAVFLLALILGLIRRRANTTTAILCHSGYNLVLGLVLLAARALGS